MRKKNLIGYTEIGDVLVNLDLYHARLEPQPSGCIEYTGPYHRQGYGMIGAVRIEPLTRIMMTTHRLAMRLKLGRAIEQSEYVIHICSNTKCCNPDHLILGDNKTKMANMKANGRAPVQTRGKGSKSLTKQKRVYKYTEEELRFIRNSTVEEVGARFNLNRTKSHALKYRVKNNYRWLDRADK